MAYQAIYRKWRPLTFEDVVGQQHIVDTLKTEIKSGKIAHAYLFCGTRGTGKTTTAKILSRAINCTSPKSNGNPCNECDSCKGILSGTIMDVIEIDAASNNGVDNIRELRDEVAYTPANVKYKVYIIDEVHMLSTGAFNALLKTLEEPPAHVIFILATTEPHKIPATIQSRCQRFDFHRISNKHIAGRIGEIVREDNIIITPDAIRLVAELGDGSMRDALSVLDLCTGIEGEITRSDIENVAGIAGKEALFDISNALICGDVSSAITRLTMLTDLGREINNILDGIISLFRDLLICKVVKEANNILDKSDEDIENLKSLANEAKTENLIHIIHTLSDYSSICKSSANPKVMLETAFVKICCPEADSASESFAARISKLESILILNGNEKLPVKEPPKTEVEPIYKAPTADIAENYVPTPLPEVISKIAKPIKAEPEVKQIEEPQEKPIEKPQGNDYASMLKAISTQNPAVASLLIDTKFEEHNGTSYIIFDNEVFRDMIVNNPTFVDAVSSAIKNRNIKFITRHQLENKEQGDPLDDIINKGKTIDQISIF